MTRDEILTCASFPKGFGVANDKLDETTLADCRLLVNEGLLTVEERTDGWIFKAVEK